MYVFFFFFFFQTKAGKRAPLWSRGVGDVKKRQKKKRILIFTRSIGKKKKKTETPRLYPDNRPTHLPASYTHLTLPTNHHV